jgi:hypothetical protein
VFSYNIVFGVFGLSKFDWNPDRRCSHLLLFFRYFFD